jgi:oligopeptide transport system permease protein
MLRLALFLLRRLMTCILAMFFVITLTFFLMKALPGGPFSAERRLPPEILANIEEKYRLNDPILKQYKDYLTRIVKLDLGPSFRYSASSVNDIIKRSFPVSAALGAMAVFIALVLGISAGLVAGLRPYQTPDRMLVFISSIGFALPSFVLAGLLQHIFSYRFNLLPAALWGTPQHAVMPVIVLAALPVAVISRLVRTQVMEVMQQDYIVMAKAKGLPFSRILIYHVLPNSLQPVITYLGPLIATVFTGSFVVEHIFAIPGLGKYFVTSIHNRDYTLIMGVTIFYSLFLMSVNLLVDMIYAMLNPRIRYPAWEE